MEKKRKIAMIISTVGVFLILIGTTFAFFNYTRTGASNNISVGRIYFNSEQTNTITLLDVFPIDSRDVATSTEVGTATITITGDTEYSEGIEYLLTVTNLTNTINNKAIPIDVVVTGTGIGTSDDSYFTNRGGQTSLYKVLGSGTISNNDMLLVGYITEGSTGVNGTVTVKAYLDKTKVAITDTYPEETVREVKTTGYSSSDCETVLTGVSNASTYCASAAGLQTAIDNESLTSEQITLLVNAGIVSEYTNETTSQWVGDRVVLTTEEWNNLRQNGVSFQVKVEANEGTWVENPNIICKRVTNVANLHTEACTNNDNASQFCQGDGYALNADIRYGNAVSLGTNTLTPGDAFDCKVSKTGGYTERFYYVSPYYDTVNETFDNTYAVLIYSQDTTDGIINSNYAPYATQADIEAAYPNETISTSDNWHGPVTAVKHLPTTSNWNNIELKSTTRKIWATSNEEYSSKTITISGHTLPTAFSYAGHSARLLTLMELKEAGCETLSGKSSLSSTGALKACNFLLEKTQYSTSTLTCGSWLENPFKTFDTEGLYTSASLRMPYVIEVRQNGYGVRPTIEIPVSKLEK